MARNDVTVASVNATREAEELGDVRVANMIALGAFARVRPIVKVDSLIQALEKSLPAGRKEMLPLKRVFAIKEQYRRALSGTIRQPPTMITAH